MAEEKKNKRWITPGRLAVVDEEGTNAIYFGLSEGEASQIASREELAAACEEARGSEERAEQSAKNAAVIHELVSQEAENSRKLLASVQASRDAAQQSAEKTERIAKSTGEEAAETLAEARRAVKEAQEAALRAEQSAEKAAEELAQLREAVASFKANMLGLFNQGR